MNFEISMFDWAVEIKFHVCKGQIRMKQVSVLTGFAIDILVDYTPNWCLNFGL